MKKNIFLLSAPSLTAFFVWSLLPFFAIAQTGSTPAPGDAQVEARKAQLQAQLTELEKEISNQNSLLQNKQKESVSLERDISIISTQIQKAQLSIKARDIALANLNDDIGEKQNTIGSLTEKIDREKEALAQLLRKTDQVDGHSFAEVLLAHENISDFFLDVDSFASVNGALEVSLAAISDAKKQTEEEKQALLEKEQEEAQLKKAQLLEKQRIEQNKSEKNKILSVTKGQEKEYQKVIKEKEKTAAQIRAALFDLSGAKAISFGKALDYANVVAQKTGVRPAFLLGIVTEESNLGENVGTGNWKTDMHPTRDVPIFQQITSKLGFDPDKMPVSKKAWYGWGGAMGPAQFIPSTWVLYEDRIAALTGHAVPNPWDPQDAFMAAGLLLSDSGAASQTAKGEHDAAMCYLAGCGNKNKPSLQFYAEDVADLAAKYQSQIDILSR